MKLYCSNIITPEALALAKKPGARYSGQAWIGGPTEIPNVPVTWLGPVVCDDEAASTADLADVGSPACIAEVKRRTDFLAANPRVSGYYGLPGAWNTWGYEDTMPRWMQGWALQDIYLRQRVCFPCMYPVGSGDIDYWIQNTLYLALSCHEAVIPMVHQCVRWDRELLPPDKQFRLINGIQRYVHPLNGRKVKGVLPWFNGDPDRVTYHGMDASIEADPTRKAAIETIQAAYPSGPPNIVKEQCDFIGVAREVIV